MNALPPGLAGYVAGEQLYGQQQQQKLQGLGLLSQLQASMFNQQRLAKEMERDEKMRGALGALSPDASKQDVINAIRPYATPDKLLPLLMRQEEYGTPVKIETPEGPRLGFPSKTGKIKPTDVIPHEPERTVGTQYERAFRTLQGLQQKVDAGASLTPEESMQAETSRAILSQQRMQIDPVTQQPYWAQPLTIPSRITVGTTPPAAPAGASTNPVPAPKPVNTVPPLTGGRKPLDAGTEKEVAAMGDGLAQMNALAGSFSPDFGGYKLEAAGQGAIELGRRLGGKYKPTADWWQAYEQWITDMRAAKFGMTLTGYELQQFNKYRSKPSDAPEVIKENLSRQVGLANAAAARRLNSLSASGYNMDAAVALLQTTAQQKEEGGTTTGPIPTSAVVGSPTTNVTTPRMIRKYNPATGKIE